MAVTSGVAPGAAERAGMSAARLDRIAPVFECYVSERKLAGVVTLVARRGEVVYFEAVGERDIEQRLPMTQDTIFRLYSQSKPVTGVAVMMLCEEGHFTLKDPIANFLPEFRDMRVYTGAGHGVARFEPAHAITIQHLLTHTSGLTHEFFATPVASGYREGQFGPKGEASPYDDLAAWTAALARQPLIAQPGTDWNYSVGMDVLGRLVEVVSGKRFSAFLSERIFEPLGMPDTDFLVPAEKLDRFASNYVAGPDGGLMPIDRPPTSPYRHPPKIDSGGGGLVGTAADYLRFAQMLANGGALDGVRLLSPRTVDLMMSNHVNPEVRADPMTSLTQLFPARIGAAGELTGGRGGDAGRAWGYGFGLSGFVVTEPGLTGIAMSKGTFSWGGAATTHFWVDREAELVGIVMAQLMPDATYPIRELMQQMTYQAIVG
ncbi:MAG: serine hydrolase [Gammaproteobacteria bacterium]|nr:serine hydrolase [Gammaproteobacteria bacterium]